MTTVIISTVSRSIRKPTSKLKPPIEAQRYTVPLKISPPSNTKYFQTNSDSTNDTDTPRIVTQCAPALPILRPKRPATMAAISGARTMAM